MRTLWHPLSTILLEEPPCFATDGLVRMLLGAESGVRMRYAGDRMWPAVPHGTAFTVTQVGDGLFTPGEVLLVLRNGIPDLLRLETVEGERLRLLADADPTLRAEATPESVLGRADLPRRPALSGRAALRRLLVDLGEAWRERADSGEDPAETVRDKYESQAAFYARPGEAELDPELLAGIGRRVAAGGRLLVVGSGAGRESFALASAGYRVTGVEFSPSMVELARAEALRREIDATFHQADIRSFEVDELSLDAVFFTYDVYSFLPGRRERIELLRKMRRWLRPDGVVLLSARRLQSLYHRMILTLQWLATQRSFDSEWGDTHTRWIPNDGSLHRSFVHVFSDGQLGEETSRAGFRIEPWQAGHAVLTVDPTAIIGG